MTTESFPLTGPIRLRGRIGHGSFVVEQVDGLTQASVTLTAPAGSDVTDRTSVEMDAGTLAVLAPRQGGVFELLGNRKHDSVDIRIRVPSGTPVKISSFTADITVNGRCGTADLAAAVAQIRVDHVDGGLRLRMGTGRCQVGQVSGSVKIRSDSSDAQFGDVGGALTASSARGCLEVASVQGAVRARVGSGSAAFGAVYADVDVSGGSGAVSIGLPAGVPARLDLTTGAGQVHSQLPIESGPVASVHPITVRARTGNGDVRLFRAAQRT